MILNLTQHDATPEQLEAGVVNVPEQHKAELVRLLTFNEPPSPTEIRDRARDLVMLARWAYADLTNNGEVGKWGVGSFGLKVMIGGAPFLMPDLDHELFAHGMQAVYAFSRRESVEAMVDGKVVKTSTFKHVGFVRTR